MNEIACSLHIVAQPMLQWMNSEGRQEARAQDVRVVLGFGGEGAQKRQRSRVTLSAVLL